MPSQIMGKAIGKQLEWRLLVRVFTSAQMVVFTSVRNVQNFQLCNDAVSSELRPGFALLHASWEAFLELGLCLDAIDVLHWLPFQQRIILRITIPWSRGVCLVLLRPTCKIFAVPPCMGTRGHISLRSMERGPLCSFCPFVHKAGLCILGGWPFRVECTSVGVEIAPQGSFLHILL